MSTPTPQNTTKLTARAARRRRRRRRILVDRYLQVWEAATKGYVFKATADLPPPTQVGSLLAEKGWSKSQPNLERFTSLETYLVAAPSLKHEKAQDVAEGDKEPMAHARNMWIYNPGLNVYVRYPEAFFQIKGNVDGAEAMAIMENMPGQD